jgi:hypothetical protein
VVFKVKVNTSFSESGKLEKLKLTLIDIFTVAIKLYTQIANAYIPGSILCTRGRSFTLYPFIERLLVGN